MLSPVTQRTSTIVSYPIPVSPVKAPELALYGSEDVEIPIISHPSSTEPESGKMVEKVVQTYTSFEECEEDALLAIEAGRQDSFTRICLQSPSPWTFKLGVLFAAKLKWCDALKIFITAVRSSCPPDDETDLLNDHPLYGSYFQQYVGRGSCSHWDGPRYLEELALLTAGVDGATKIVRILITFINPNFYAMNEHPFLGYVYMNKDETSRRSCIQAILPSLVPFNEYLFWAAENGDLPTVMYFVDKMKGEEFLYDRAAQRAIEQGHEEVAKWLISEPGLISWKDYRGILQSAANSQNYDIIVLLSQNIPESAHCNIGILTASALWRFLNDKDKVLYTKLAPGYTGDQYLLLYGTTCIVDSKNIDR